MYGNSSLVPAAFSANPGSADQLYGKYYFANATDEQAFVADPTGGVQPNETIVYSYYTAADVQNGVAGAYVGAEKSVTDNLITPANGDPRSAYTNTTTFQYDSNGNVIQKSGPSGTINYMYDLATQRHTETWTGTSYADAETDIAYGYNLLGELASVTVPKENGVAPAAVQSSTQYNATGGTSTTTLPNTVYSYDAGGRLTSSFDSATGITTSYAYKPDTNYISQETVSESSGSSVAMYSFYYRADGLKTGETDTTLNSDGTSYDTRTLTWNYDALDRLTQEKSVDATDSALNYADNYSYDLNSNRVSETEDQGNTGSATDTVTSTYNADDELTQAVDANTGTTVYTYDNNGSQIETQHTPSGGTSPDTTTTNHYDLQGQMAGTQTTNSSGTTKATYEYGDQGNRIIETNTNTAGTTTTTYYLVDSESPTGYPQTIEQAATPGSPQITYVWGKTLISETYATGATIPGVGTASSPTTYYILTDAHGSTRVIIDATGVIVQRLNYDAFGNALGFNTATALTTQLYDSMSFDPASGNYYDHARFYNASIGEFTQADYGSYGTLTDPMSYLPYTFTQNDPTNFLDPTGHISLPSLTISIAIGASLGGLGTMAANYELGRPITEGLATGIFLGAVLAPIAVAVPAAGVALAGLGIFGSWNLTWQVWENPRSTPGQMAASLILFGTSLAGAAFASANLAENGWYNPIFTHPPVTTTPLTIGSSLSELFAGVPDDAMVHVSPAALDTLTTEGVRPSITGKSYWFRWGDVKGLTIAQYRGLVGGLAAGGDPNANTFVFKLPGAGVTFTRGGVFFDVPEYTSTQTVFPDAGGIATSGGQ